MSQEYGSRFSFPAFNLCVSVLSLQDHAQESGEYDEEGGPEDEGENVIETQSVEDDDEMLPEDEDKEDDSEDRAVGMEGTCFHVMICSA